MAHAFIIQKRQLVSKFLLVLQTLNEVQRVYLHVNRTVIFYTEGVLVKHIVLAVNISIIQLYSLSNTNFSYTD